jgi:fructose-1,6-bisphosphatase/inositol monophosphatase family enzyme
VLVAQGSAEVLLEYGVAPYDMAAPYVVVTEGGRRMTDLEGRVLTSNGVLHDELLRILGATA